MDSLEINPKMESWVSITINLNRQGVHYLEQIIKIPTISNNQDYLEIQTTSRLNRRV